MAAGTVDWLARAALGAMILWEIWGEGWTPKVWIWALILGAVSSSADGCAIIAQHGYDGTGEVEYEFAPFEFEVRIGGRHYRTRWSQLTRIEETPDRFRLWIDGTYHVLPKRFLDAAVEARWREMAAAEAGRAIQAWAIG